MRSPSILAIGLGALAVAGCSLIFDSEDYAGGGSDGGPDECDVDGDGFAAEGACGGADCNDGDPDVYPGAAPDCFTPEYENCDHAATEEVRTAIWGYSDGIEAGFLPVHVESYRLANGTRFPPQQIAVAGVQSGRVGGTGMVMWLEEGVPVMVDFELNDPRTSALKTLSDMTDGISLAACATNPGVVGFSVLREAGSARETAYINELIARSAGFDLDEPTRAPVQFLFGPMQVVDTSRSARSGLVDCYVGDSFHSNFEQIPRHIVRGLQDPSNTTEYVAGLDWQDNDGTSGSFRYSSPMPPANFPSGFELRTGAGRYAFFTNTADGYARIFAWDSYDSGAGGPFAPMTPGPQELQTTPSGGAPTGIAAPDLALVARTAGATSDAEDYLLAIADDDVTRIHRIRCGEGRGALCNFDGSVSTDISTVANEGAHRFAMGTWNTDPGSTGNPRVGAVLAAAYEDAGNVPLLMLHFLNADGTYVPLHGTGNEDRDFLGPGNGDLPNGLPMDLQVSVVNTGFDVTVLVASSHHFGEPNRQDIRIGGFHTCRQQF